MQISIIVPTLNEADRIGALVAGLRSSPHCREIIVADGGSSDGTAAIAERAGAHVLTSQPGRGRQLALGAGQAQGEILLFLHADTELAEDGLAAIVRALDDDGLVGGNFRVVFDGDTSFARWLTGFYAWFRRYGLFYGDSAIFVRAEAYRRLGGIRPIALMEDYDLCRRMQRLGAICCIDEPAVVTSSRRFSGRSPTAIVTQWLLLHALYHLGLPPDLLSRLYDSGRRRQKPS